MITFIPLVITYFLNKMVHHICIRAKILYKMIGRLSLLRYLVQLRCNLHIKQWKMWTWWTIYPPNMGFSRERITTYTAWTPQDGSSNQ